ncbi:hypothetical protein C0993_003725, partial [Termitomyces sp. T159_Od127]
STCVLKGNTLASSTPHCLSMFQPQRRWAHGGSEYRSGKAIALLMVRKTQREEERVQELLTNDDGYGVHEGVRGWVGQPAEWGDHAVWWH